jgi:hypothetical protein
MRVGAGGETRWGGEREGAHRAPATPRAAVIFQVRDTRIQAICSISNPNKLRTLRDLVGVAQEVASMVGSTVWLSQGGHREYSTLGAQPRVRRDMTAQAQGSGRWDTTLDEHDVAVRELVAVCERIPPDRWLESPAPGKWSPGEVVLHLCRAYALGRDAGDGGPGMRLRVSPSRAWALRTLLLPVILATQRFPRGVRAPAEVVPDAATSERWTRDVALARLQRVAEEAAATLRRIADLRPEPRVIHAYFGPLAPRAALRVLSAHTRHHARGLASLAIAGDGA